MNKIILILIFYIYCTFTSSYSNSLSEKYLDDASLYSVKLRVSVDKPFIEDKKVGLRLGSGFLVDKKKGLIITNAHVTGSSISRVRVAFRDNDFIHAKQVYVDQEIDMAIIKIKTSDIPPKVKVAKLMCNDKVANGASVAAFGHPKGLSFSASRGIVSKYRFYRGKDVIQTDAAINSGNSGGPLIDLNTGLVIGINKSSFKNSQGLSFAVPSNYVCIILNLFKEGKNPAPIELPLRFAEDREAENYKKVSSFFYNGKNIEIGSLLIEVDGKKINSPSELSFYLRGRKGEAKLTFQSNQGINSYKIKLKPRQKVLDRKFLYLSGAIISKDYSSKYDDFKTPFFIHSVIDGTEAELAGLWQHCWIKSVERVEPRNLEHIKSLVINKKEVSIITRCFSSRTDVMTSDYFLKLKIDNQKIYLN